MFDIEYKGGNGVVIFTKKSKLIADPKLSLIGLKDMDVKGMIELATEPRFRVENPDVRLIIDGPGEYEIGDFSIRGTQAVRHIDTDVTSPTATIYTITVDDIKVALLGNIAAKLSEDQLETLGVVDILIIPVGGGGYTLDGVDAARLVSQIDPKVVIPVHYADSAVKYEVPQDLLDSFIKELGAPVETVEKYKLKSAAALPQTLTIVELKRS